MIRIIRYPGWGFVQIQTNEWEVLLVLEKLGVDLGVPSYWIAASLVNRVIMGRQLNLENQKLIQCTITFQKRSTLKTTACKIVSSRIKNNGKVCSPLDWSDPTKVSRPDQHWSTLFTRFSFPGCNLYQSNSVNLTIKMLSVIKLGTLLRNSYGNFTQENPFFRKNLRICVLGIGIDMFLE